MEPLGLALFFRISCASARKPIPHFSSVNYTIKLVRYSSILLQYYQLSPSIDHDSEFSRDYLLPGLRAPTRCKEILVRYLAVRCANSLRLFCEGWYSSSLSLASLLRFFAVAIGKHKRTNLSPLFLAGFAFSASWSTLTFFERACESILPLFLVLG
ncbi:uncharacterized protein EV420DRAFT_1553931 [Desarmillaria tabescens]|uniref:Uncharacterized protein n=1 Tax=Armillaria tabescens TaxID=1929756 RepID=A0AA39K6J9_ARMTA|nr:uncharacterized protein EV420DRAFT_1553931 [Desarmillaria tabescens]KAK0455497.1 hypothetical protein EV420DRAFT_1553931 [Desarmillaria tabescens]